MDDAPIFAPMSDNQRRRNFNAVCKKAKIGVEVPVPAVPDTSRVRTALGPSIMQQERDFRNAIQPDSPVSALLQYVHLASGTTTDASSAKQPLVQAPAAIRESALLRKLNAAGAHATLSPARRGKENAPGPSSRRMEAVGEEQEDEENEEVLADEPQRGYDAGVRQRELANQKARIVSQMTGRERHHATAERSSPRRSATTTPTTELQPTRRVGQAAASSARVSLFDVMGHNLDKALKMGEAFRSPRTCLHDPFRRADSQKSTSPQTHQTSLSLLGLITAPNTGWALR